MEASTVSVLTAEDIEIKVFYPEDESRRIIRKAGSYLPNHLMPLNIHK